MQDRKLRPNNIIHYVSAPFSINTLIFLIPGYETPCPRSHLWATQAHSAIFVQVEQEVHMQLQLDILLGQSADLPIRKKLFYKNSSRIS